MKVIAAYLLSLLGGNSSPTQESISAILQSVGIEAEKGKIDQFLQKMEGKDLSQVLEEGKVKLASFSPPSASPVAVQENTPPDTSGSKVVEKDHDHKKSGEFNSDDDDFGFGISLFD